MFGNLFGSKKEGLSLVVITYKRYEALQVLLESVLEQDVNFPIELTLVNNDPDNEIPLDGDLGKVLKKFKERNIHNSPFNYGVSIRYFFASFTKYKTIMFLDDDIKLKRSGFIQKMWSIFHNDLRPIDWISAWAQHIKVDPSGKTSLEPVSFMLEEITELTEVDLVGPGISMFSKELLIPEVLEIPPKYWDVDNVWAPLTATKILGTRKYYMPSFRMARFTDFKTEAMHSREGVREMKDSLIQKFVDAGYKPVNKDK